MKNIIKKIIFTSCICYTVSSASVSLYSFITKKIEQKKTDDYIEKNLSKVIIAQEKSLGIKHSGIPKINIYYEEGFKDGSYNKEEDSINLIVANPAAFYDSSTKEILDHELGHFYVDKLEEKMNKQLPYNISESIARYFENTMNNKERNFNDMHDPHLKEYRMVKPLIKRYGLQRAIKNLFNKEKQGLK